MRGGMNHVIALSALHKAEVEVLVLVTTPVTVAPGPCLVSIKGSDTRDTSQGIGLRGYGRGGRGRKN